MVMIRYVISSVNLHISVIYINFPEIARDFLHRTTNYNVVAGLMSPVHDKYGKEVSICDYSDIVWHVNPFIVSVDDC